MKLNIGHLYPEFLNLYGDRGNIRCLVKRCAWRGIETEVFSIGENDTVDFSVLDIVLLGGGSDREQRLVCEKLLKIRGSFRDYVESDGVVIAVCGGYQLLGKYYQTEEGKIKGLGLLNIRTVRGRKRLTGNIVLESGLFSMPVVGFENHAGRTFTGDYPPLGRVIYGYGNDGKSGYEGVRYRNVFGTYLHGPLLPKNPLLADELIRRALRRKYGGEIRLEELEDREEKETNRAVCDLILHH